MRVTRALAAVSGLALLLSGCTVNSGGEEPRSAEWQAREFADVYEQQIEWHECGENEGLDEETAEALDDAGFDLSQLGCALVTAPYDWNDPSDDQTIELSIVHIPSTGEEPRGTLLANPGGPGATGVDFMFGMALAPGFEQVAESYDLLGFDPRGIGGSNPIDCDGAGSEIPAVQMGVCIAENPLTHTMGTSQVARDMELLRHLMGEEKLYFLGYSYGTMLGATYATLFPERVGRMVLDSAENAEWASLIHNFDQQVAIAKATVALATTCTSAYSAEVEVCPFTSEDTLLQVLTQLDAAPLTATDGARVTGGILRSYLSDALYESHFERGRTLARIASALSGDQDAIDEIASGYGDDGAGIDMTLPIVLCHSFPIEPDVPGLLEHIEKEGMPRLLGGPEITDETLARFVDLSCYALPESGLDITESFAAPGVSPILVIGITGDHATPYQYAEVLANELGNARLLTLDGQGHAASYSERSTCVDDAATDYLLHGRLPQPGTVCLDD